MGAPPSEAADARHEWLRRALAAHEEPLRRYTARLTGNAAAAGAVVAETFRKLWTAAATAPPPDEKLAEWLFRTGRNAAIEHNRLHRPVAQAPAPDPDGPAPTPRPARVTHAPGADPLTAALDRLSQVQQEVLRLKLQYGMSYREIGGILNLTVPNVAALIHSALKQLRANPQLRSALSGH